MSSITLYLDTADFFKGEAEEEAVKRENVDFVCWLT